MELSTELLVFLVTFLAVLVFIGWNGKRHNFPPGPRPLPVIGNLLEINSCKSLYRRILQLRKKYGDIFSLQLGPYPSVVLCTYDLIHDAFVKQADITVARPHPITPLAKINKGRGILFGEGPPWKAMRRFTLATLRDLGFGKNTIEQKILDECLAVNSEIEKHAGKSWNATCELLNLATCNVICSLIFGSRYEYDDSRFQILTGFLRLTVQTARAYTIKNCVRIAQYFPQVMTKHKQQPMFKFNENLVEFIDAEIEAHRKTYDSSYIRDYLDMYIKVTKDGSEDFTTEDIYCTIRELFFAGTETSANTLNWALLYMIEYPEIQRKCQEEIDRVVGCNRPVRMDDKKKLPFTEATALEVQRNASIVFMGVMHRVMADMTIGGYLIPKDTILHPFLYAALRDPAHWQDPDRFWPERFLDDSGKVKKPDAFIPFSTGPRVCLGETLAKTELFLFFANIIQQFRFSKVNPTDNWLDKDESTGKLRSAPTYQTLVDQRN